MDITIKNGDWLKFTDACEFNRDMIGKPLLAIILPDTHKVLLIDVKGADVLVHYYYDDISIMLDNGSLEKIDVEFKIKQKEVEK